MASSLRIPGDRPRHLSPRDAHLRLEAQSHVGQLHKPSEFYGLDPNLTSTDGPARFELRREAGTLAFDGSFHAGKGSGAFRFTSSPEFVQAMKGLGYSNLSIDQLLAFATQDV